MRRSFLLLIVIVTILFAGLIFSNPGKENNEDVKKFKKEIMDADKAFSRMSEEKGMAEAFLFYAADDVIRMKNNQFPNMNKEELRKDFENFDIEKAPALTWEPVKADAALSGELGYTFGKWILKGKDDTGKEKLTYGNYMTVWKRQLDGSWKFVLDGGNTTPPPVNKSN